MTEVPNFVEYVRIQETMAAYSANVDIGEIAKLVATFAVDGVFVVNDEIIVGRDNLDTWFRKAQSPDRRGKHLVMNILVQVDGERATSTSDFLFMRYEDGVLVPAVVGSYIDELVKSSGAWVFARRQVVRLNPTDS